ncbi:MAG: hypothetical protein AB2559_13045, partial [Candidatus Thiodiazotropha endolucinida]
QAYLLTGDAANADPVCSKSPHHEQIVQMVDKTNISHESDTAPLVFRNMRNSKKLTAGKWPKASGQ